MVPAALHDLLHHKNVERQETHAISFLTGAKGQNINETTPWTQGIRIL